jgi:RNA polymerase sigma factor (sigma-70 family)
MTTEVELLEAWRAGDKQAADELIGRYFDNVCRFFRSKLDDDVEDLVQQTFVACLEGLDSISKGSFRAYLFGAARNLLMSQLRRRYRQGAIDTLSHSICDLATSPSRTVARKTSHAAMIDALQKLPIDTQILLELAYWNDLSGKEIAQVLAIEENTVRSRLARARVALRETLERDFGKQAANDLLVTLGGPGASR